MRNLSRNIVKYKDIIDRNLVEVNEEYILAVKKSVVDFVLGETKHRQSRAPRMEDLTSDRLELNAVRLKYRHRWNFVCSSKGVVFLLIKMKFRFLENRLKIQRYLFSINPCVAQILKAWHTYDGVNLVNIKQLTENDGAFDLSQFAVN